MFDFNKQIWNLDLPVELALVFLLTASIGWFMGRYLCKSGEQEEKLEKNRIITAYKSLDHDSKEKDKELEIFDTNIKLKSKMLSNIEQKKADLELKFRALEKQKVEMFTHIQELEKYKNSFKSINEEIEMKNRHVQQVKANQLKSDEKLEEAIAMIQKQKKQIQELENIEDKQNRKIGILKENSAHKNETIEQLSDTEKKNYTLQSKLETLNRELKMSKAEEEALSKQLLSEQNRNTTLKKEHEELKLKSKSTHDKFSTLTKEKANFAHTLEILKIENSDYLGRLRAISSVVNVVGAEES